MDTKNALLHHFLGALAYRAQQALNGAPTSFGSFEPGQQVRSPHEILLHMTSVLGYARAQYRGGRYQPPEKLPSFNDEIARFHAVIGDLAQHLEESTPLQEITAEQLLQGPFADAMTHVGQLAMIRRLSGSPVAPENFIDAKIDLRNLKPAQPDPSCLDKI